MSPQSQSLVLRRNSTEGERLELRVLLGLPPLALRHPHGRFWHVSEVVPRSVLVLWEIQTRPAGKSARDIYRPGRFQTYPYDRLGENTRRVASDK